MINNDNNQLQYYLNCNSYIRIYNGIVNINSNNGGIYTNGDIFILDGILTVLGTTYENRQFIAYKEALIINGGVLLACSNNNSIIDPKIAEKKEQYLNHINSDTKLGIYNN